MKKIFIFLVVFFVGSALLFLPCLSSLEGKVAGKEDVELLKKDVREGRVKVNKTRLKQIRALYGEPENIRETESKINYNYGDIKLDFSKEKYLRKWEYDYTYGSAYSDDIQDLVYDLEAGEIIGDYVSYSQIVKDYGKPTKVFETHGDGNHSVYYYGQVKLTFENYVVVYSWSGRNLSSSADSGVLKDQEE